ncbi:MAG: sigma-70 family RNA polymerase sigma factor [Hansschlegelia sp.]
MSTWRERIGALFITYHRQLETIARRSVGNGEIAADIVQDIFVRALAAGPRASLDDDRRVLFASARNAAIEHHRSERRRADLMAAVLPDQFAAPTCLPDQTLAAREGLSALEEAMMELSPRCRDIFIMRRVDGISNQEIASRHGISVNSVEKHIARALRHCQIRLSDRFQVDQE